MTCGNAPEGICCLLRGQPALEARADQLVCLVSERTLSLVNTCVHFSQRVGLPSLSGQGPWLKAAPTSHVPSWESEAASFCRCWGCGRSHHWPLSFPRLPPWLAAPPSVFATYSPTSCWTDPPPLSYPLQPSSTALLPWMLGAHPGHPQPLAALVLGAEL